MPTEYHVTVQLESGERSVSEAILLALYIDSYIKRIRAQNFAYVREFGTVTTIRNDSGEE